MKKLTLVLPVFLIIGWIGTALALPPEGMPPGVSSDGSNGLNVEGSVAIGGALLPGEYTVATLPAAGSSARALAVISDGTSNTDCTSGGGSTRTICFCNGSAWASLFVAGAGTDDQTAAEVTSTATGNIEATNVDAAIAELEAEKQVALSNAVLAAIIEGFSTHTIALTDIVYITDAAGNSYKTTIDDLLGLIAVGHIPVAIARVASPTFTGLVTTEASDSSEAGLRLPHGAAPSSPTNGDIWTTTAGIYVQINGSTVGPLGVAGSGTDANAIHDNVAGEIVAVTEKTTPADNDEVLIEDSADSNNKKSLKLGNIWSDSFKAKADALYATLSNWSGSLASPGAAIGTGTPVAITGTTITASSFVTSATAGDRYIEADNGTETLSTSVDDVAGRLAWSDSDSLWHLSDGTDWADFLVTNNSFAGNTETGITITPQADGTVDAVVSISASEVAAGTLVIESEGISSNDNDTTIPSCAAVKDYADSVAAGGGLPTTGGTMTGNITLDDGSTDSPSIIFTDETDETATITKTDSSFLGITTAAAGGVNVLVGNLKVGNGTPGQTLDGEDAYIEGLLEVDGVIHADGGVVGTTLTANYTIVTPQSLSVTADDDVTVGTELTSSVVLCTGDDDSADETLTLQDGVTAGTILTFIIVANVDDTDDAMIIDAETDSTCLGCPDSGIFTYETEGSSLTLYWTGSAWTYQGSIVGE